MRIILKAYGSWQTILPGGRRRVEFDLPDNSSVEYLLSEAKINLDQVHLIVVNESIVDVTHNLRNGDTVILISPVEGG